MVNGVISNAVSGLLAQSRVLQNTSNNIANVSTSGATPDQAYQPVETQLTSQGGGVSGGGVKANSLLKEPATVATYAPDSGIAGDDGFVYSPNVDLAEELITSQLASTIYKANAAVIRVDNEIADETLNLVS